MKSMHMRQQLFGIRTAMAGQRAYQLINAMQEMPVGEQVAAHAIVFLELCRHFEEDPRDVLHTTDFIIANTLSQGRGEHIRAVRNYIKGEFK